MDKEQFFYDGRDWTKEQAIQAIKDHTLRYLRSKKGDWDFYESHRYAYDLLGLLKDNHLIDRDEAAPFYERFIRSESVEEQPVPEQVKQPVSMNKEQALAIYQGLVADIKKQPNESMFDFHQGRADGFILSLMYQYVITHKEYAALADELIALRFGYID